MFDKNWLMTARYTYHYTHPYIIKPLIIFAFPIIIFLNLTYSLHLISFEDCLISVTLLMFFLKTFFKNSRLNFLQKIQKNLLIKNNGIINKQERGIAE
jgi:hypothetical protein